MSEIHFVGGEKGGVGKSVFARLLCQYCIDKSQPFAAIDADISHGALLRYYSDYAQAVDLEVFESADQIMDRALGAERRVLVDLPAQSSRLLQRWFSSGAVLDFAREMGVKLYFWHVSDGGFDSINELQRNLSELGDSLQLIVVKNLGRSADFSQFDESEVVKQMYINGGRVIELPALHATTMYKIDRKGSSFWSAAHSDDGEYSLLPKERQRTRLWLTQAYGQVEKAL
jgi:hypothetical protein